MHTVKETDMIAANLDLLLKKMEGASNRSTLTGMPWTRTSCAKFVAMMDTQGMTALRPVKAPPTSSTTIGIVHNKLAKGGAEHTHLSREVTILIQISIRVSIRTNLPCDK